MPLLHLQSHKTAYLFILTVQRGDCPFKIHAAMRSRQSQLNVERTVFDPVMAVIHVTETAKT
jgi:hypothetical protein